MCVIFFRFCHLVHILVYIVCSGLTCVHYVFRPHQVRSHGRNIAVNIWFKTVNESTLDLSLCGENGATLTLDQLNFTEENDAINILNVECVHKLLIYFIAHFMRYNVIICLNILSATITAYFSATFQGN